MIRRGAAFLVALLSLAAPVSAADQVPAADVPAMHWKYQNPFCEVFAQLRPLYDGSGYELALLAANGNALEAHVTLVSDTDAYDAHVPVTDLSGPAEDRQSGPVIVKLGAATIKYFFVDSYSLDGGHPVTCPSYVFPIGKRTSDSLNGAMTVVGAHLQSLGKPPCGQTYRPPGTNGDPEDRVGAFGDRPLFTEFDVYIDSSGHAIDEKMVTPSGVEGVDSAARGMIQQHTFRPAQFLCTPVVGEMLLQMKFTP
jgi:hypothetical protein